MSHKISLFCLLLCAFCLRAWGQSYTIDWFKISGGGGTSTNGQFAVTGTVGQADATVAISGGNYSLTGGFWSLISVVQTPAAPALCVCCSGNAVKVYWQSIGSWTLQQNSSLAAPSGWVASSGVTTSGGTNYLNVISPTGKMFFRLQGL